MVDKLAPTSRHAVQHDGRVVYEWSQTIQDVDIYAPLPSGQTIKAKMLFVNIQRRALEFGIVGADPYMTGPLFSDVIVTDSTWMIEDGELHISLQKAHQGEQWEAAIEGHTVQAHAAQEDRQRLLLERFQHEHPGMDFSTAQVNGEVPDPAKFLGGIAK